MPSSHECQHYVTRRLLDRHVFTASAAGSAAAAPRLRAAAPLCRCGARSCSRGGKHARTRRTRSRRPAAQARSRAAVWEQDAARATPWQAPWRGGRAGYRRDIGWDTALARAAPDALRDRAAAAKPRRAARGRQCTSMTKGLGMRRDARTWRNFGGVSARLVAVVRLRAGPGPGPSCRLRAPSQPHPTRRLRPRRAPPVSLPLRRCKILRCFPGRLLHTSRRNPPSLAHGNGHRVPRVPRGVRHRGHGRRRDRPEYSCLPPTRLRPRSWIPASTPMRPCCCAPWSFARQATPPLSRQSGYGKRRQVE